MDDEKKEKRGSWILILLLVLTVVGIAVTTIATKQGANKQASGETTTDAGPEKPGPASIAIPGYEALQLKADVRQQEISLSNPEKNECYFVISLRLEDGTELWRSDYIKPGETSEGILLSQSLPAGTYRNAVLKYECFRLNEEKSPLNGAETKLTLIVR